MVHASNTWPRFRVRLSFIPREEGGRQPVRQSTPRYRPTLHFAPDDVYIGFVGVDLLAQDGTPLPDGSYAPASALADIMVYDDEIYSELRKRVKPGVKFDVTESTYVVARGVVEALGTLSS